MANKKKDEEKKVISEAVITLENELGSLFGLAQKDIETFSDKIGKKALQGDISKAKAFETNHISDFKMNKILESMLCLKVEAEKFTHNLESKRIDKTAFFNYLNETYPPSEIETQKEPSITPEKQLGGKGENSDDRHFESPRSSKKTIFLWVFVFLTGCGSSFVVNYLFNLNPAQSEIKNQTAFLSIDSIQCKVYARGNDVIGNDTIPWLGVHKLDNLPLLLSIGDSIEIVVDSKDSIWVADKIKYDDNFKCGSNGVSYQNVPTKKWQEFLKKQRDRADYILLCQEPLGSLVFYIDPHYFKFDSTFFLTRKIKGNSPTHIHGNRFNSAIKQNGALFLAVNDHYLFKDEMDWLGLHNNFLLRPEDQMKMAYKDNNYDLFYDDNDGFFDITVKVFRKRKQ